jgi:DNA-binding CsgD family transcriptional regulator
MASVATAQLLGRETELARIRELLSAAADDGGVLLVRGEIGIGKSALLAQAAVDAAAAELRVLRAAGIRTEARLPFAGLHQLLHPLLGGLGSLPAPQRSAIEAAFGLAREPTQDQFLICLAALTLLTDAASEGPILAVVDDVQWLDPESEQALAFVARRLGSDPIALLLAIREGDSAPAIESAEPPLLAVQPLDDAHAREMLARTGAHLDAAVRERILHRAAGNPLALAELPAAMGSAEPEEPMEPIAPTIPVTARVERSFAGRLGEMPEVTATLLLVAALDDEGAVADILDAGRALGLPGVTAADLAPAVDAGLIHTEGGVVRFRHPLARSVVARTAGDADRRMAHGALAGIDADPDRVAWHRAAAASGADEATAGLLEETAERARNRGALSLAVSSLERAARLSPDSQARAARLLKGADLAYELGRFDILRRLVDDTDPLDVDALEERRQAWLLALRLNGPKTSREEQNIRLVIEAATRIAAGDRGLAMRLLELAASRAWWMDVAQSIAGEIVQAASDIAADANDPRLLWVKAAAAPEHGGEVVEIVRQRLAGPESAEPFDARLLGTCAMWAGDLDTATQFFALAVPAFRREGRLGFLARAQILSGWCSNHLGRLSDAGLELDEGLRLAVETDQENFVATAHMALAEHHALRGDLQRAAAEASEAERHARQAYADGLLANVHHARGILALADGRSADAYDSLRHIYRPGDEGSHAVVRSWAIADLADAAIAAGHAAEAAGFLDALDEVGGLAASPWQRIGMGYARAVLAADTGDDASAEMLFSWAMADDLERWPLPRARLLLAYGAWLRRRRRVADSRDPLRVAREMLDAIGVPWLADRARRELAATGEVSGERRPRSMDDLTPQELQIARLAADGLSNRDIGERLYLSHRTVGFHLSHVYPKLGVSGRAQLHAALGTA